MQNGRRHIEALTKKWVPEWQINFKEEDAWKVNCLGKLLQDDRLKQDYQEHIYCADCR